VYRKPARVALVVLPVALLLSGPIGPSIAGASQKTYAPTTSNPRIATFRLKGLHGPAIRSASLRISNSSRRIATSRVRAGARAGVLKLQLPRRLRPLRASARRNLPLARAAGTQATARLVVVTDTTAPLVSWQTPVAGQTVSGVLNEANGNCRAAASDNVGVHHVDFYLDGVLLNRELSAPYGCAWDTSKAASGAHVLKAVAFDAAGNSNAASIQVLIAGSSPPPPPSVTPISATTYYVSSSGSDSNSGLSPSTAWRTVAKANAAALNPGDGVLFEGSHTFSDSALSPSRSGTASARVVYGSYGTGKASLPQGIYLNSVGGLAFQNLAISGPNHALLASGSGSGAPDITLERLTITNVGIAVNSANWGDVRWTIRDNTISQTRDSGMILFGSDFAITGNSILDTGTDSSISYGKHGIYLKVIGARVTGNTIRRFQANGVSVRYRNSVVDDNVISDGPIGIAWFQYDPTPGTSYWRHNTISGTTSANVYVSPRDVGGPTRESFVITDNTLSKRSGVYTNLKPTTGSYTVRANRQN
jgi:hypothetical protein